MGLSNDLSNKIHNSYQKYYKALRIIPDEHYMAEEGYVYGAKKEFTVTAGQSIYLLGVTDATQEAHMQERVLNMVSQQAIDIAIELYTDAVVSANGTLIPSYNTNLNKENGSTFKVYLTPTITDVGNKIDIFDFFVQTENKISSQIIALKYFTLKQNNNHILKFTNNGAGDVTIDYKIFWHEVPEV